jgi:LL-diaminopimelate aminotransferase
MEISVAQRLQQVEEYYFSKKLREIEVMNASGAQVINLGIGSPDLPPHPDVIARLQTEAAKSNTHAYQSYKGAKEMREAMSHWYQRIYGVTLDPNTEILPLMGSKEGIVHLCMTYLQEGDEALIPDPGYPAYASAVRLSGATARPYLLEERHQWLPDLQQLAQQDLSKVKMMWVNYPHMPTGSRAPEGFFSELVAFAKAHQILLCHDNPYSLILNDQPQSLLSVPGANEVAVELNSLSKSSNMAGWRIGMMVGAAQRIDEVLRFKSNMDSGMFLPLQLAAAQALSLDETWYSELNAVYAERRSLVFALLDQLGCSYSKDQVGLFVWAKIPETYADGYALSDEVLHNSKVFITPGGIFGAGGQAYVRISLCAQADVLQKALTRIKGNE